MLDLQLAEPGAPFKSILAAAAASGGVISAVVTGDVQQTTAATGEAASIKVLQVDSSQLHVAVADAPAAGAAPGPAYAAVDISKLVDTVPPVLAMVGPVYMEVVEQSGFSDPGVTAYDDIGGNRVLSSSTVQLCQWPGPAQGGLLAGDTSSSRTDVSTTGPMSLVCSGTVAFVDTSTPTVAATDDGQSTSGSTSNQLYVIAYTARDAAGNAAMPLSRYVAVMPRCASPERWCADLNACSINRLCSSVLVPLAAPAGTGSSSSSSNGGGAFAVDSLGAARSSSSSSDGRNADVKGVLDQGWLMGSGAWRWRRGYDPPVDRTPPSLKLRGKGNAAITTAGEEGADGSSTL